MQAPVIIAFDPALPLVAAQAIAVAAGPIAEGEPVDWRALGLNEVEILAWWRAGLVRHPVSASLFEHDAKVASAPPPKPRARR